MHSTMIVFISGCLLSIFSQSFQYFHAEAGLIPGAPGKGTVLDPPPQETHLPPTAQRGQSPDPILLASKDQNQVHPGEDQRLTVQDTAVVTDITTGRNLPSHTGETYCITGLKI